MTLNVKRFALRFKYLRWGYYYYYFRISNKVVNLTKIQAFF